MAVDAFLKLWDKNGNVLIGETSDDNMTGAMELNEFSFNCLSLSRKKGKKGKKDKDGNEEEQQQKSAPKGEEALAKSMFTLKVGKPMDQASPMLVQSYSINSSKVRRSKGVQPFEKGVLFVRKPGAYNFVYLRFTFLGMYVLEYKMDVKEESSLPTEDLTFGFRAVSFQYTPQKSTGGRDKPKFAGWNLKDNTRDDTQDGLR
jgi:type VI protein secretion system component Hcp